MTSPWYFSTGALTILVLKCNVTYIYTQINYGMRIIIMIMMIIIIIIIIIIIFIISIVS